MMACPCCAAANCGNCSNVDGANSGILYQEDPDRPSCDGNFFAYDQKQTCLSPQSFAVQSGASIASTVIPTLDAQYHGSSLLLTTCGCQTEDFSDSDEDGTCCTSAVTFSRIVYQAYCWSDGDCLWKMVGKNVITTTTTDQKKRSNGALVPCSTGTIPPARVCTEECPETFSAAACCNHLP